MQKVFEETTYITPIRRLWTEVCFWGRELFYSLLTVIMTGILAQNLGLADDTFKPVKDPSYPKYAIPLFIAIVLFLYLIRYTRRIAYGLTEIEMAILGFLFTIEQNIIHYETGPFMFSTAGSVYLGIRGLDNVVTGVKSRYMKSRL